MHFFTSFILFFITIGAFSQSPCLILNGKYNNENVFLQNPYKGSGVGFCVDSVFVNGEKVQDQITSSAFEIDLSNFNMKIGDPCNVKIYHGSDCLPKVLNKTQPRKAGVVTKIEIVDQ